MRVGVRDKLKFPVRAAMCLSASAWAAMPMPPHVDQEGMRAFAEYRLAPGHKAFVIAPGGTWAWRADLPSVRAAQKAALADCGARTSQRCLPFALDQEAVLDPSTWSQAWAPYLNGIQARKAAVGMRPGSRFPDIVMTDANGRPVRFSDFRGRVVLAHFWGSWCPHCVREMPDLQRLYDRLGGKDKVAFILLPVRETISRARQWARRKRIRMPVYDGGATVASERAFRLADGGRLADRELARVFPSTYVLDRHGVVLFSHAGPVSNWLEYEPLLRDAAARSGN